MELVPNPLIIPVGLTIGVLISMPFGPVNLLALQRAVERGFVGGLAAGIGIMLGDGMIAFLASMGVNALSGAIRHHRESVQLVGGIALLIAGWRMLWAHPQVAAVSDPAKASISDHIWDIPQTFLLTLANPAAVLGLITIFGGVSSFVEVSSWIDALTMVAAIMGGSFSYWLVVSKAIAQFRHLVSPGSLRLANFIAGLLVIGFGVLLVGEIFYKSLRHSL